MVVLSLLCNWLKNLFYNYFVSSYPDPFEGCLSSTYCSVELGVPIYSVLSRLVCLVVFQPRTL